MNIEEMVGMIASVAFSDSHVTVSKPNVRSALEHDLNANGQRELSEQEIVMLICGDDEGEIPEELIKLYPNTSSELEEYWH